MVEPVRFHPIGRMQTSNEVSMAMPSALKNVEQRLAPPTAEKSVSLPKLVDLAQQLQEQGPPVDYVRIAQIRQAIAGKSYVIDANAIAKAIINLGHPGKP